MSDRDEDQALESLLDYLRRVRGFDFTGYKRPSLKRRIHKRMEMHQIESFEEYCDYLQVHPEEFPILFNTILINVTGFFRDPDTWTYLREEIIPDILRQKNQTTPIRVWTAGCASGEESYSIGMLLYEALGAEAFQNRVKIYATDIDQEALSQARQAIYSPKDIEDIPEDLRTKYLEPTQNDCYTLGHELRRAIIFGRHNLIDNAPISRLDLLVCRNTLMYFNAETQARILTRFHFALNENSALFLGKAEMLLGHTRLFTPLSLQHRIFKKVMPLNLRNRVLGLSSTHDSQMSDRISLNEQLQAAAFDTSPVAQIIIDAQGRLVLANRQAQTTFNLHSRQIGTLFQDLELSYRPTELRSLIDQAYRDRRTIIISNISRPLANNRFQNLEIQVSPLFNEQGTIIGVSLCFLDTTEKHQLESKLERSNHELETTNEELQSTNEELETTNEELQSTNEELQAINEESRQRTQELNHINAFLNSILISFHSAIIVLDSNLNILSWNPEAENLWGLRADEVIGQNFLSLDINLPVYELSDPIQECLAGQDKPSEMTLNAVNRRGRNISCHISFNPLVNHDRERCGVILLMDAKEE
ncbi:MAG: CheR family methyltransferase [Spirulinaceae cyanobacterium]